MKGFTIIELTLVIAIFIIIAGLSLPFLQSFQTSTDLNTYTQTLTQTLRRAQQKAWFGQNNAGWGVFFDNSQKKFILFSGANYAGRNPDFDEINDYPEIFQITPDFGNEINFAIYSGQPQMVGQITISSPNNETKIIMINSLGIVQ